MSAQQPSWSSRLYRALLRLLPGDFRSDFGSEMEDVFHKQEADARRHSGVAGLLRLWGETIRGIFTTAPREHLSILRQDLGYAWRMMRRNPGYTLLAVLTLGLGIGANTAIFSVVNGILMRPLPYRQGDQLVMVRQQAPKAGVENMGFSYHEVNDYSTQNKTLSDSAEYHGMTFNLVGNGETERVRTGVVSPAFFDIFGVKPILGRNFLPSDDEEGAPAVLILSYEYWQNHQGGDRNIIGRKFEMNDKPHTVIGVLPPVPQYPDENDVYMPTSACPFRGSAGFKANRDARMMSFFGRLKPGVSLEQASADMTVIASRLGSEYPKSYTPGMGYRAVPIRLETELTKQAKPALMVLLGAAAFVLLIACANVANLTLARMAGRERELMVRAALGAGQSRLFRQLLTESLLIAMVASGLGLLLAYQGLDLLIEFASTLSPRAREVSIDSTVLGFTVLAAVFTSVVFGSVSAFSARDDVASGLKEGGRNSMGLRQKRVRQGLIICQVAFCFVLLIGAGLMLRSLAKLQRVDPGFVPQRVLTMRTFLNWSMHRTTDQTRDIGLKILERVKQEPGVLSAAISSSFPLEPGNVARGPNLQSFVVEGRVVPEGEAPLLTAIRAASPDYFKTLGIPLLQGRFFQENDDEKSLEVALINRTLAKHFWGEENPEGRRISFDKGKSWITIVGVVGDVLEFGLQKTAVDELYLPFKQNPSPGALVVRTAQEPKSAAAQIRAAVAAVSPGTAITNIKTLEENRAQSLSSPRTLASLLGLFSVLALVIAASGIGGILALSVSERIHEIGIRIALGARSVHVLGDVVGRGVGLVVLGVGLGWVAAMAFTRLLQTMLFQVTATDPWTFAGVSVILLLSALVASYLPARRALRVDPLVALRCE